MKESGAVGEALEGIFDGFERERHGENRFHFGFGKQQGHGAVSITLCGLVLRNVTRELRKSEGDAVAEHARFGRIEDEQFGAGADGQGRRATVALTELRGEVDVQFRRAVGADDVQHQAVDIHDEDGVAPNREAAIGIPFCTARGDEFAEQVAVAGQFHNPARRRAEIQKVVGSVHDGAEAALTRNSFARLPGLHQALANGVGKYFSSNGIEDVDKAVVADRDAQLVLGVRARAEMKFAEAVAVGKKNEDAVADGIGHVNGAGAIERDRRRMIHSIFLERKQWFAFVSKFGDEGAAWVGEKNIAKRIGGDSGGLAQLTGVTSLRAPLADVGERRSRRWRGMLWQSFRGYVRASRLRGEADE